MENNEQGQSTIEFLMTFIISISFLFFFVKMALNYTNGYLVHYANFMASRSFLVADTNQEPSASYNSAFDQATTVFGKYYIETFIPGFSGALQVNMPTSGIGSIYVGTYVEYSDVLSFTKLVGGKKPLNLRSESFLGKEVVRRDCEKRVCDILAQLSGSACDNHSTRYDNGC